MKKPKNVLTKIKVEIKKSTFKALERISQSTGMTIGEMIDRLTVHLHPDDPVMAGMIVTEEMLYAFTLLDNEGNNQALRKIVLTSAAVLPDKMISTLPQKIRKKQEELDISSDGYSDESHPYEPTEISQSADYEDDDARVTIQATVMRATVDGLNQISQSEGITIGETINKLSAQFMSDDPEIAANIVMEEMIHVFSRLNEADFYRAVEYVVVLSCAIYPSDYVDELPQQIKKRQEELEREYSEMPKEEWDKQYEGFQKLLREIYNKK